MSAAGYHLQGDQLDLSTEFEQNVPPYLPKSPPPTYTSNYGPCFPPLIMDSPSQYAPHEHHLSGLGGELSPGVGPDDTRLSGFDLAESIWSQNSDLTLDNLALSFDSASTHSRSSMSSHWSAPPLTPPTSPRLDLQPPSEPVPLSIETPVQESEPEEPEEPDSPAPAYSRDPLEVDPALLASLDSQLRLRPFEAFEDLCWACFSDSGPAEPMLSSPSQSQSLSRNLPSLSCTSLTTDSAFSDSSTTIMFAPPMSYLSPPSPSQPPPAYPTSKPLPSLPPSSPIRSTEEHTHPGLSHNPPVVISFKSPIVANDNPPILPSSPVETVQFFPVRPPALPRSKSGSSTKPVQRLTTAIARLRGRE